MHHSQGLSSRHLPNENNKEKAQTSLIVSYLLSSYIMGKWKGVKYIEVAI